MVMDKELEGYAQDCIRLAGMTDDPAIREPLLKMAREWMQLARGEHPQRSVLCARPDVDPLSDKGGSWSLN
jgi:hypothetical protein